ncbi:hypothetical protein T09_11420 [Trichinella sp. T9]|nr:hypothetical protein T09_11420 [Trichinella sp. T9]
MPGADVERGNRPPGTQGRLTEYLPPSRRSSSSNAFIAAVPSAAASSAGAIPSASISQNLRKSSSSEPSPCNRKTPASGVRFRTAPPPRMEPWRLRDWSSKDRMDSGYHGVRCEVTEQETRGPQGPAEPIVGRAGWVVHPLRRCL